MVVLDAEVSEAGGKARVRVILPGRAEEFEYESGFLVLPVRGREREAERLLESLGVKPEKTRRRLFGEEREFFRIRCGPGEIRKMRDRVKGFEKARSGGPVEGEYEHDVSVKKLFFMDTGFWCEDVPKSAAFDIETHEGRVIAISLCSERYEAAFVMGRDGDTEEDLVLKFFEALKREGPDVLVGYNSDSFDLPVLKRLSERVGGPKINLSGGHARIEGTVHVDVYRFISAILAPHLKTESMDLGSVARELLGRDKGDCEKALEAWISGNRDALADYCLNDSRLALELFRFLFPQMAELSGLVRQPLFDVTRMTYSQLVEWFLARKTREYGEVVPNQPKYEEIQKRKGAPSYTGGFVKEPEPGLHERIAVVDFRSMYPSIIATYNISPETADCGCCEGYEVPELGYRFCKRRRGFVSSVVRELIEERERIKKGMKTVPKGSDEWKRLDAEQKSVKTVANAVYGYYAFPGSRWYCYRCAESAAAFGRSLVKSVMREAERQGFEVLYADTDSCFLKYGSKEGVHDFVESVNSKLPGSIRLELQGFYPRGIFIPKEGGGAAKKRYALLSEDGGILIRGFETVRRDWCPLAKKIQRRVIEIVLTEGSPEKAVEYVRSVVTGIKSGSYGLEEFVLHEQLTKEIEEYSVSSPHVSAAAKMLKAGKKVYPGDTIRYFIARGKGPVSSRAVPIGFPGIPDWEYYVKKQVVPAALRVLRVFGVTEDDLIPKKGLGDYL